LNHFRIRQIFHRYSHVVPRIEHGLDAHSRGGLRSGDDAIAVRWVSGIFAVVDRAAALDGRGYELNIRWEAISDADLAGAFDAAAVQVRGGDERLSPIDDGRLGMHETAIAAIDLDGCAGKFAHQANGDGPRRPVCALAGAC